MFIGGVLANFCRKVQFEVPIDFKLFYRTPLDLSRRDASFKYPYYGSNFFLTKKLAKIVDTQKFGRHRLNHLILHKGSYPYFRIRWIFRKLEFFCLFREDFQLKKYNLLERTDKINLIILYII